MKEDCPCYNYITKQKTISLSEHIPVADNTQLIIVIPCYNEPGIMETLESLFACETGDYTTEILLLVNSYLISPETIRQTNKQTWHKSLSFAKQQNTDNIRLIPLLMEDLPGKQTGAGLPRKTGMDEAVRRFISINNTAGIIISLDADCTVEKNYLQEIHRLFYSDKKLVSATLAFHHPYESLPENNRQRQAIELYEIYLNYYRDALRYTGYPYAYHTIGSAFAVRCQTYCAAGGMGKQQAGEDFYFLQKVFPLGKTMEITSTCVYPSFRTSDRVPFGTGPALSSLLNQQEIEKYTYTFESFEKLKILFDKKNIYYKADKDRIMDLAAFLPQEVRLFLETDDFPGEMEIINKNTATIQSFEKRFFISFNAFKILKYLNFVHPRFIPFREVISEYNILKQHL